jgi:hypothetical protein
MGSISFSELRDFGGMDEKGHISEILSLAPDSENFIVGSSVWFNVIYDF